MGLDTDPLGIKLFRPCGMQYPDGKQFGEWGPMWGYHFADGKWVEGKKDGVGQHGGYDIRCPLGTVLHAPARGKVLESGWQNPLNEKQGYGRRLLIEFEDAVDAGGGRLVRPLLTLGHFSEIWVPKGAMVMREDDLGLSGETGNTSGAHLHAQLEIPGPYPRTPLQFEWVTV